ncbi:MAG: hypothetical protein IPG45_27385 [Deltaproteobacteria bacterium]|jgi:hypothetical protein|nr:hypothetical protein [Deltaproteobacteria bacterium]
MSASGAKLPAFNQPLRPNAEGSVVTPALDKSGQFAYLPENYQQPEGDGGNGRGKGGKGGKDAAALVAGLRNTTDSGLHRAANNIRKANNPAPSGEAFRLYKGLPVSYARTTTFEANRRLAYDSAGLGGGYNTSAAGTKPLSMSPDDAPFNPAVPRETPNPVGGRVLALGTYPKKNGERVRSGAPRARAALDELAGISEPPQRLNFQFRRA